MNPSIPLGQTRLGYRRQGDPSSPAVLLLHPWFGCARFWEPVLPVLAGCMVLVPDLYSPAGGDWKGVANPAGLAGGVTAVLDAEGVDRCRVAGNSMGGILAQLLATSQPDRVSHLALIGTGARSSRLQAGFKTLLNAWLSRRRPSDLAALTQGLVAPRASRDPIVESCTATLAAVDPDYIAAIPTSTLDIDLRSQLGSVTAKTLVVRGELDSIRSRAQAHDLASAILDARMVEIADAGHSPMLDSADIFNPLLTEFFEL